MQIGGGASIGGKILSSDERQIALSVLERLRDDLFKRPRLRDGKPLTSASAIREYLTEQIDDIRSNGNPTPKASANGAISCAHANRSNSSG
jgi:HPt (histidine-containing phosphotransfer) domain-containing protein